MDEFSNELLSLRNSFNSCRSDSRMISPRITRFSLLWYSDVCSAGRCGERSEPGQRQRVVRSEARTELSTVDRLGFHPLRNRSTSLTMRYVRMVPTKITIMGIVEIPSSSIMPIPPIIIHTLIVNAKHTRGSVTLN